MLWLNTHASSRKQLSPYIDGQLSSRERTTLEAHLAGCDACRRELNELRATIAAVGGLSDVEPSRSFALTPRMLERAAATPPVSMPPLATGMRLAGAGVALVLAIVVVGDFASMGGGNGGSDGGGMRQTAEFGTVGTFKDGTEADAARDPAPAETSVAEDSAAIGANEASPSADLAASADKAEGCLPTAAGGGVGGPVTATQDATPTPQSVPITSTAPIPEGVDSAVECAPVAANVAPEQESPAAVEAMRDGDEGEIAAAPESVANEDGGVSALTLIEIILAAGLVALVAAIGIEHVVRRRGA